MFLKLIEFRTFFFVFWINLFCFVADVKVFWNLLTGVQKNIFCFLSNFAWNFFQYLWFPSYVTIQSFFSSPSTLYGFPNNRKGWNNKGGGVDIVIIINNRGVGRGWKHSVGSFLVLILNTTLFSFFSTNGHIFPTQFNTRKLRNDGF